LSRLPWKADEAGQTYILDRTHEGVLGTYTQQESRLLSPCPERSLLRRHRGSRSALHLLISNGNQWDRPASQNVGISGLDYGSDRSSYDHDEACGSRRDWFEACSCSTLAVPHVWNSNALKVPAATASVIRSDVTMSRLSSSTISVTNLLVVSRTSMATEISAAGVAASCEKYDTFVLQNTMLKCRFLGIV
jgi:hypothetical protein